MSYAILYVLGHEREFHPDPLICSQLLSEYEPSPLLADRCEFPTKTGSLTHRWGRLSKANDSMQQTCELSNFALDTLHTNYNFCMCRVTRKN
eukprot:2606127-Pyramimonas_sp.AAC.1